MPNTPVPNNDSLPLPIYNESSQGAHSQGHNALFSHAPLSVVPPMPHHHIAPSIRTSTTAHRSMRERGGTKRDGEELTTSHGAKRRRTNHAVGVDDAAGLSSNHDHTSMPPALQSILLAYPRAKDEAKVVYARRLDTASRQCDPKARVDGQPLTIAQLALLSGATKGTLLQDPLLRDLPPDLLPILRAYPRAKDEASLVYARRLDTASRLGELKARVDGQPLTIDQLALLSGATKSTLRQDTVLRDLPSELVPILFAYPRTETSSRAYARWLDTASQKGEPKALVDGQPLTIAQLALLSGATESSLRQERQLRDLPPEPGSILLANPST